jgi:hypothetical protein
MAKIEFKKCRFDSHSSLHMPAELACVVLVQYRSNKHFNFVWIACRFTLHCEVFMFLIKRP